MPNARRRSLHVVAFAGFASAALAMLVAGLIYATTEGMLPYHEQALGRSWAELTPGFQSLYLMMCRAIGVPTVILALALLILLAVPWRRGEAWALVAVPVLSLGYSLPMLVITIWVRFETGANTPIGFLALGSALALLSATLTFLGRAQRRPHPLRRATDVAHV